MRCWSGMATQTGPTGVSDQRAWEQSAESLYPSARAPGHPRWACVRGTERLGPQNVRTIVGNNLSVNIF